MLADTSTFVACSSVGLAADGESIAYVGGCGRGHFSNRKPCGEALVKRDGEVLLIRRAADPWRDHWDIPGGFCDPGEHPLFRG